VHEVTTTNSEGFIYTHVAIGGAGMVRLAWQASAQSVDFSRAVAIS
jgi:hypothetical protein